MADHREKSQLIGDFLREAAVLVGIAWPLESLVAHEKLDLNEFCFAMLLCGFLLAIGIVLEGKDEL
jgi:hypothetical protein